MHVRRFIVALTVIGLCSWQPACGGGEGEDGPGVTDAGPEPDTGAPDAGGAVDVVDVVDVADLSGDPEVEDVPVAEEVEDLPDLGPPPCESHEACDEAEACENGACVMADACAAVASLALNVPLEGDTADGLLSIHTYACAALATGDAGGREQIYELTSTVEGPITLTLQQTSGDTPPHLTVLSACDGVACLAGVTAVDGEAQLELDATIGQAWLVAVDSPFGTVVGFELTASACLPACEDKLCGDDGCGGVCGDCPPGHECDAGQCLCVPQCTAQDGTSLQCGDDGCQGSCGACGFDEVCDDGQCVCVPQCDGADGPLECGADGCGGTCGDCAPNAVCEGGQCKCIPTCVGPLGFKECGDNGCGGSCGICVVEGQACDADGFCACAPQCEGPDGPLECGDDGCGGTCGECAAGVDCVDGACYCAPACDGPAGPLQCGDDGCGGTCGECAAGEACLGAGSCVCVPKCDGGAKECGDNGCGGSCGECAAGALCQGAQCCAPECAPGPNACGDDGCGGTCGECAPGVACSAGQCECTPTCFQPDGVTPMECGDNGCGGSCGACAAGSSCDDGACCTPLCGTSECGADGCGGSCGTCADNELCTEGQCACVPDCADKQCGADGCGSVCGYCPPGEPCSASGICACVPDCSAPDGDKVCGDDGCGGSCGACGAGEACTEAGACACAPQCDGPTGPLQCGDDGCDGTCGVCTAPDECIGGQCVCTPECEGPGGPAVCGADGCGGQCGSCGVGEACAGGQCVCVPDCKGSDGPKQCGDDGCGSSCGDCPEDESCSANGICACVPDCGPAVCGGDGCGGSCGACAQGEICEQGQCECVPQCKFKECGPDSCDGTCGSCGAGDVCGSGGLCECVPQCAGKACGPDSCGGTCGGCSPDEVCDPDGQCACVPVCEGKQCGDDGCGTSCGECAPGHECQVDQCVCVPESCEGKQCGYAGCGVSCGTCDLNHECDAAGMCQCIPQCAGKECGADGCTGECGECAPNEACQGGTCACVPDCSGPDGERECGGDGCGGSCGACAVNEACSPLGVCECVPDCTSPLGPKTCGDDGCGGTCGSCASTQACEEGHCVCVPACGSAAGPKDCGDDGCDGVCGVCPPDELCNAGHCECVPDCAAPGGGVKECGSDGCAGSCGDCPTSEACGLNGFCGCEPDCAGLDGPKECGGDGCGGVCGLCQAGDSCDAAGICVPPVEGESCASPLVVGSLPHVATGDTDGALDDHSYGADACPGLPAPGGADLADHVYRFIPSEDGTYSIGLDASAAAELYLLSGCGGAGEQCVAGATGAAESALVLELVAGIPVSIVVDGAGGYTLTVDEVSCQPQCLGLQCGGDGCGGSCGECTGGLVCAQDGQCGQPAGDDCSEAPLVGALPFTVSGTTVGATDNYHYSAGTCPPDAQGSGLGSADRVWFFEPPADDEYLITVAGASGVSAYVVTDCGAVDFTCVAGGSSVIGAVSVKAELDGGSAYYVIVDAALGTPPGAFTLTIDVAPCLPDCAGKDCGPNGCGGTCGACSGGALCHADGSCGAAEGQTCAGALPVGALPFTAQGDTTGAGDDYYYGFGVCPPEEGAWGFGAPERVYRLDAAQTGDYGVTVSADYGATIYVVTACDDIDASCVAGNEEPVGDVSVKAALEAGETYYLIVDGASGGVSGAYELTVTPPGFCQADCTGAECGDDGCGGSCGDCGVMEACGPDRQCSDQTGDTCAEAPLVGPLPFAFDTSTVGFGDDYSITDGACPPVEGSWGFGAPDMVWRFVPPASGAYHLSATGAFGPILYVSPDCADINGTCLGGAKSGATATATLALVAGETYFVFVDAAGFGASGDYTLTISAAVCPPDPCASKTCGDDGCGGSCGDCPEGQVCSPEATCVVDAGDTCEDAPEIAALPYLFDGDTSDGTDVYSYLPAACPPEDGGWGFGAPDDVFRFVPAASGNYLMRVTGDFEPTVYVVEDCTDVSGTCTGGEQDVSGLVELEVALVQGTTYHVIVDGYGGGAAGPYTLQVVAPGGCLPACAGKQCGDDGCGGDCGACPGTEVCMATGQCAIPTGQTCEGAMPVGPLPFAHDGDTTDATDDYTYAAGACPGAQGGWGLGGPDHAFRFDAPADGAYRFHVTGEFGPTVYLVTDCGDVNGTCLAGEEAHAAAVEVQALLTAGAVVYAIVDGWAGGSGPYTLTVEEASCTPECAGAECGDDGCGGSCGSCDPGADCQAGECVQLTMDTCAEAPSVGALPFAFQGTTDGLEDDYSFGPGACPPLEPPYGFGSPDAVWRFDPAATGAYALTLTADFEATLYVAADCADVGASCAGGAYEPTGPLSLTLPLTQGSAYYIIVDGAFMASGVWTLTVAEASCDPDACVGKTCGPDGCGGTCGTCPSGETCTEAGNCQGAAGGDSCAEATAVGALPYAAATDTTGASDLYSYTVGACPPEVGGWGFGAADKVWSFTPPADGDYVVAVDATFGATVYVVEDCAAINDTCAGGAMSMEGQTAVTVSLSKSKTYFVIVDGFGAFVSGVATLTVSEAL